MGNAAAVTAGSSASAIRGLTCLMFFMFAMTTDSVGMIIPQVIAEFRIDMTTAGALQYGSMLGIALAGLGLGFLADRLGRKRTILLGLAIFATTAFLFPFAATFTAILALIFLAGCAIGIFKTGALGLVGDMSADATELTSTMNLVEGFFGVGAIIGPLIVAALMRRGVSWRWLYVVAGALCTLLLLIALFARYPARVRSAARAVPRNLMSTLRMIPNRYALGFSFAAFSYVIVECAIYVWMPTLLASHHGESLLPVAYALPVFFVMRAGGRFLGAWLLNRVDWSAALALCATAILACFAGSVILGVDGALYLLPASGLFMSILYPTLNSKGIGCFEGADHGAVAGIILFFTCAGAFLGPLAMGMISDASGSAESGFVFATAFAALLAIGLLVNWIVKPAHVQLARFTRMDAVTA